ncbi:hypothetical protein GCM10007941_05160 [Amphritea balenae]|nr:hypothetical protein GCM10007941_05160 [Amphritea balenae]
MVEPDEESDEESDPAEMQDLHLSGKGKDIKFGGITHIGCLLVKVKIFKAKKKRPELSL